MPGLALPNLTGVRTLDKYLLREFFWPLLYCFDAFALLWVVMELFDNLPEFVQHHAKIGQVLRYLFTTFPEAFVLLLPMSLLLGLLFCLANLAKHNELVAMRAGGVSMARLALPLLGIGVLGSVVVFAVNELFVPHARDQAARQMNALKGKGELGVIDNFFFANPSERRTWFAQRLNLVSNQMDSVEIHEDNADGTPRRDIYAVRARWINKMWQFYEVRIDDHTAGQSGTSYVAEANFPELKEKPDRLAIEGRKPEQLSTAELRRQLRAFQRTNQPRHITEFQVELHYRYAFPWICLLVVWIAIPLGTRVSRSGPMLAVGATLMLVFAFYFLTQVALKLGTGGRVSPALAAWLTNIIFAIIGTVLLARAR